MHIRPITKSDIEALKAVIESNQLFPAKLLDGMVESFLVPKHRASG